MLGEGLSIHRRKEGGGHHGGTQSPRPVSGSHESPFKMGRPKHKRRHRDSALESELAKQRDHDRSSESRWHDRKTRIKARAREQEEKRSAQITEVWVGNLPFVGTVASELKDFLEVQIGPVSDVKLISSAMPERIKGFGFVSFVSPDSVGIGCASSLRYRGRTLKMRPNPPRAGQRRPIATESHQARMIQVGLRRPDTWVVAWEHAAACKLVVNGAKRRLCIFFELDGRRYQAQLYMKEIIGYIELQRLRSSEMTMFITMRRPPKVFSFMFEEVTDVLSWSLPTNDEDDRWERTTDPTGGAMSNFWSFSLTFPLSAEHMKPMLNLLAQYHLIQEPFVLLSASSLATKRYCARHDLLDGVDFAVRYELDALISTGILHAFDVDDAFVDSLRTTDPDHAVAALRQMAPSSDHSTCILEPLSAFRRWLEFTAGLVHNVELPAGTCLVSRCVCTPFRVIVLPREQEVSNRVLRQVPSHQLIRVGFTDENLSQLGRGISLTDKICSRIATFMRSGVTVAGREFKFLAFSSSQLKEHSCWFLADGGGWTAQGVRDQMGDFSHIMIPGKYAARMGQCFSTTLVGSSAELGSDCRCSIPDVERNGFVFSDGVGTISLDLALEVAEKRNYDPLPSALQIRLGGVKGVVTLDPRLSGRMLCTRPSMEKFSSVNCDLEICTTANSLPCFLNRQLITLLSTLGIPDLIFQRLQDDMLRGLDAMLYDSEAAISVLRRMGAPEGSAAAVALEMLEAGYRIDSEAYLSELLRCFRAHQLQELSLKTRLFVPHGSLLMGIMDETATLQYGQVFMQLRVSPSLAATMGLHGDSQVVTGEIIVAKNPCLHPGDILRLDAVDVPALRHLTNVVIFPQLGDRPHPNETSGADLDGDLFFCCWDKRLRPMHSRAPMAFDAAPAAEFGNPVTISAVCDFFIDFMRNDNLGVIANAHLAHADASPEGASCFKCMQLAELHSQAVDFPKSGMAAVMPKALRIETYPDFMEKKNKASYVSEKIVGVLYRQVRGTMRDGRSGGQPLVSYDERLEFGGFDKFLDDAFQLREKYNYELQSVMNQFGIKSEAKSSVGIS